MSFYFAPPCRSSPNQSEERRAATKGVPFESYQTYILYLTKYQNALKGTLEKKASIPLQDTPTLKVTTEDENMAPDNNIL